MVDVIDGVPVAMIRRFENLLGSDFSSHDAVRILGTTSRLYERDDVSARDIFWIYEWMFWKRDSPENRKLIAEQLNAKHGKESSRDKVLDVVRILSEGNKAYRPYIEGELLLPHLNRGLQETVVRQMVYSANRMRAVSDANTPDDVLECLVDAEIEKRLDKAPVNRALRRV
ncbi:MAG: hypothetical protein FJY77_00865 [Candidatus Altiarchaeales archaeon]|nr:hypothetical protein [Candidatus Altiarchaeales archaeon]